LRVHLLQKRRAFLHIPKTAGTSVVHSLFASVPARRVSPYRFDRTVFGSFSDFERLEGPVSDLILLEPGERLREWDVVAGHFSLQTLLGAFDSSEIFCLFREPRARLLSHFWYWFGFPEELHRSWSPYHASRVPSASGWLAFLTDSSLASQTDNIAFRMLLAGQPLIREDSFLEAATMDQLIPAAFEAIDQLGHVHIIDGGTDFWPGLSSFVGVNLEPRQSNVTTTAGRHFSWESAIDLEASEALLLRTFADRQIWSYVAERTVNHENLEMLADAVFMKQLAKVAADGAGMTRLPSGDNGARPEADLAGEIERRDEMIAALTNRVEALERSRAWRLTAPVRRLTALRGRVSRR
jgi:hypothetical protein